MRAEGRVGPYELREVLGRGAMGVVHRAVRDGRAYALKLTSADGDVEPSLAALQFRREAAAIARLDHPSLVRVVEFGEHDGSPYLVMDLVEGQSLADRIRSRLLEPDEAVSLARTLADALVEVHRYGLVHRDIKPANIVLGEAGRAYLIDFGLSTDTQDDRVVGTLPYAAPEQVGLLKRPVGPPADLYALGATLYEALTGRPPLVASSTHEFLHLLAAAPPADVRDARPSVGPALAAVLAKLLAKDPDDRYQGGRGLIADLDQLGRLDAQLRGGQQVQLGAHDHPVSAAQQTALIGRRAELETLKRCWKQAARGQVTFVQLEGEAGSGKTRLVRELCTQATDQGALVWFAKCQERETAPFGALREAADEYADRIARMPEAQRALALARLARAVGDGGPQVRRLSRGLASLLPDPGETRFLDPDAEQQRHYEALSTFLRELGADGSPLVLAIDDVQWLDDGTRRVLARLATDDAAGHLLVVSTCRSQTENQENLARYVGAVQPALRERIAVRPLRPDAVEALITARLGGRSLDRATLDRLVLLTQGNPFAIGEYIRSLLDGAALRPVADGWTALPHVLDALALPKDVVALVVARLDALDERATEVLGMAALIGGRFSADRLGQLSGIEGHALLRMLEAWGRAGLVEQAGFGSGWSFVHDGVREACVERLPAERRRALHQRIAEILDGPDCDDLYALARHYAAGEADRNPARVAEVHLLAGLRALDDHSNDEAFELLEGALAWAERAGTTAQLASRLYEGLGRASAVTGRLDRAFSYLVQAFASAESDQQRFRLQYLLTFTYASEGRNDEALRALYRAFQLLDRPYPQSTLAQLGTLLVLWVAALVYRFTGIGRGSATGEDFERRLVLSRLHYAGSMIALFQGNPLLMVQFVVRDFYNVHFLGDTGETAVGTAVYGAVLGMLGLRRVMEDYTGRAVAMAERVNDRAALAVCKAYQAVGTKWAGDVVRGNQLLLAALPELHRHVPGSWYHAMMICEQAYTYLHTGHSSAAIQHVRAQRAALERTNNKMFRYNTVSVQYAEMMVTEDVVAASQLWQQLEAEFAPMSDTIYVRLARVMARLEVLGDQREIGPEAEIEIQNFHDLRGEDYYSHAARVLVGYVRLAQLEKATPESLPLARRRLRACAVGLSLRTRVPVFACNALVWRAVLARTSGRVRRAARLLDRASRLATRSNSRRGAFYVALERARLARLREDGTAHVFAAAAYEVATREGWRHKAAQVRAEFELEEPRSAAPATFAAAALTRTAQQATRYANALLQVSLASASSLDPDAQARNALVELARVLGAERALLYLVDPGTGELVLKASTGQGDGDASTTVVRQVAESREPVILTGTDHGGGIGSSSIVTRGLRSIIATPLLLRERFFGVVYLDSRLARGMFNDDDLTLLRGVANHIAIAIDTARAARVEAERSAMQRDYELLGAVQNLLLPKVPMFSTPWVRGVGVYQPALHCGGDWWWYGTEASGRLLLLLGDVSGHGAAPAMVTSHVAGAFHSLRHFDPHADPAALLAALGRSVRTFGDGFHMTLSLLRVDPVEGTLTFWNAGGPPVFVLRPGARCEVVYAAGRVVGDPSGFEIGSRVVPFAPGDRLLACTDGLIELRRAGGREIGPRQVVRWLESTRDLSIDELPARIGEQVSQLVAVEPQHDDITFIVAEATEGPSQ